MEQRLVTIHLPPPRLQTGARFLNPEAKTGSASLKIDSKGGLHLAYADFIPTDELLHAVYMFCAAEKAACADPQKWQTVALSDLANEVQLALTPNGKPRMLLRTATTHNDSDTGDDYYYAARIAGSAPACRTAAPPPKSHGISSSTARTGRPSHCDAGFWNGLSPVLALDPAGNPRVAYDARYDTRCWYDDPNDDLPPYLQFWQLRHAARTVTFPQKQV